MTESDLDAKLKAYNERGRKVEAQADKGLAEIEALLRKGELDEAKYKKLKEHFQKIKANAQIMQLTELPDTH